MSVSNWLCEKNLYMQFLDHIKLPIKSHTVVNFSSIIQATAYSMKNSKFPPSMSAETLFKY